MVLCKCQKRYNTWEELFVGGRGSSFQLILGLGCQMWLCHHGSQTEWSQASEGHMCLTDIDKEYILKKYLLITKALLHV